MMVYSRAWVLIWALVIVAGCGGGAENPKLINGQQLPDVTLPDIHGNNVALSSLQGNLVLVDMWASWCKPCRKQHPYLVDLYRKYENSLFDIADHFIIYQVSFDQDEEAWRKAIHDDGLYWPYHMSELKGWKSKVVELYGIESIPANFLLDGTGTIIGKNLTVRDLDKVLENRVISPQH